MNMLFSDSWECVKLEWHRHVVPEWMNKTTALVHLQESEEMCMSRNWVNEKDLSRKALMLVKQCHFYHPPVITIVIGGMFTVPFPVMGGLWHGFTHIIRYEFSRTFTNIHRAPGTLTKLWKIAGDRWNSLKFNILNKKWWFSRAMLN